MKNTFGELGIGDNFRVELSGSFYEFVKTPIFTEQSGEKNNAVCYCDEEADDELAGGFRFFEDDQKVELVY